MDSQGNESCLRHPDLSPLVPEGFPAALGWGSRVSLARQSSRGAHTAAAHTSAAGALGPPASRWDFCTLVLLLLVLSPVPFPHCSAPLWHHSRTDSAVRGAPSPYVSSVLLRISSTLTVSPSQPAVKERSQCQPDRRCCWDCSK